MKAHKAYMEMKARGPEGSEYGSSRCLSLARPQKGKGKVKMLHKKPWSKVYIKKGPRRATLRRYHKSLARPQKGKDKVKMLHKKPWLKVYNKKGPRRATLRRYHKGNMKAMPTRKGRISRKTLPKRLLPRMRPEAVIKGKLDLEKGKFNLKDKKQQGRG